MKEIRVVESVLKANDVIARDNRTRLNDAGVLAINLMSAPGSGKTALLEKTLPALAPDYASAVLVGDLQTTRDAERVRHLAKSVTQINTGRGCHLDAAQVETGLSGLELNELSFVFIENVGNMVCPAAYDLGEHLRVILLSTPEGDDKAAKYPTLFQIADAVLLTKIDLYDRLDYKVERVRDDLSRINTRAPLIELSAATGVGMDIWLRWLRTEREARRFRPETQLGD